MDTTANNSRFWGFKESWRYIREAFSAEYCQVVPLVYFFVVVLVFGGSGLWESLCSLKIPDGVMACNTIALSVASAACVDLVFSRKNRPLQALGLLVLIITCGLHVLAVVWSDKINISGLLAFIAWLFAHVTWWVVNVHNPNLTDVDPDDSSGGPTSRALAGCGEYKGLKV